MGAPKIIRRFGTTSHVAAKNRGNKKMGTLDWKEEQRFEEDAAAAATLRVPRNGLHSNCMLHVEGRPSLEH